MLPAGSVAEHVNHARAVSVYAAQGATAREGVAIVDDTWTREQAYVVLTRGKDETTWHVVAEDDAAKRAMLRNVLTSSDRDRRELVAQVTRDRLLAGRHDLAPAVARRLAGASGQPLSWAQPAVGADADIADVSARRGATLGD